MNYDISSVSNIDALMLRELRILGGRQECYCLPPYFEVVSKGEVLLPTSPAGVLNNSYQYHISIPVVEGSLPYLVFKVETIQVPRLLARLSKVEVLDFGLNLYSESPTLPAGIKLIVYWVTAPAFYTAKIEELSQEIQNLQNIIAKVNLGEDATSDELNEMLAWYRRVHHNVDTEVADGI